MDVVCPDILLAIAELIEIEDVFSFRLTCPQWAQIGAQTMRFRLFRELQDRERYHRYKDIVKRLYQTPFIDILSLLLNRYPRISVELTEFVRDSIRTFRAHSFDVSAYRSFVLTHHPITPANPERRGLKMLGAADLYAQFSKRSHWSWQRRLETLREKLEEEIRVVGFSSCSMHRMVNALMREQPPALTVRVLMNAYGSESLPPVLMEGYIRYMIPTEETYESIIDPRGPLTNWWEDYTTALKRIRDTLHVNQKTLDDLRDVILKRRRGSNVIGILMAIGDLLDPLDTCADYFGKLPRVFSVDQLRELFNVELHVASQMHRLQSSYVDEICRADRVDWFMIMYMMEQDLDQMTQFARAYLVQKAYANGGLGIIKAIGPIHPTPEMPPADPMGILSTAPPSSNY